MIPRCTIFRVCIYVSLLCAYCTYAGSPEIIKLDHKPSQSLHYNNKLYVSHADDKKITIINTFDNTLNTTLTLTEKPTSLILAGQKIYVLHGEKKSVSVLDPIQNKIIKTITTGN